MTWARELKFPMMKANSPIYKVLRMRRAITSSSGAIAQNSPAKVMSMAIRMPASQWTSPGTRPNPESMYWVKVPRKLSITPVPFTAAGLR